jgi:hypothetical protein
MKNLLALNPLMKNANNEFLTADCGETCGHCSIFAKTITRFIS